ncbi:MULTISPECIES: septum formation initiator [unclassified Meiothermus]|uniref:septum formation initiator n=1 Tax=unclassified Meiothermus TaxID=370471 RepID=UPI000D7D2014|nr:MULTISPECIES: septum formation initiator [unclassified Meiothermus]PZA05679.1 septum formation initiator [Meiothermus sp. Pnk-1]RYM27934.1 septum formation initiator [Meiothermus sp. PNK-Is4]
MERPVYRFLHLLFALGSLHLLWLVGLEFKRTQELRGEINRARAQVAQLEGRLARLTDEISAAQTPEYRDALVRRMGYVRKDELLIPSAR